MNLFVIFVLVILNSFLTFAIANNRAKRIVGGENAELPPEDDPVVYVRYNSRFAKITGIKQDQHYMFKGLRYAQPPIKRDRFQRPRRFYLEGNINATNYPYPCLQYSPPGPGRAGKIVGDEDCLFLNVYTQYLPDGTEGLPVIIWIHGGGFKMGSASQYGVQNLVDKRIVLVTIQYRLGTLGFLSTGSEEFPGNTGLWDMALAIEWVRHYIGFFGGNPHRIVVMGQGTGASSALQLALSNIAQGNVKAIVAMSGSALSHWASENTPQVTAHEIAEENGCPTQAIVPMIKCLQNVPADSIIMADIDVMNRRLMNRGFTSGLNGRLGPSPWVEGPYNGRSLPPVMENEPMDDMTAGRIPKIPLLIGVTKDETSKAVHSNYRNEIISKLFSIPHYMDQVLVSTLQSFTGLGFAKNKSSTSLTSNKATSWTTLNPLQFTNYLKVPKNDITKGLQKIAEATTDALFNLPAFLTADLWSKQETDSSPTYLYRFSHNGNAKKGRYFFNGMPLVGNQSSDSEEVVSHGDDLSYLFEVRELNGTKIEGTKEETKEDRRVRDIYTQMIADFARSGKIYIDKKEVTTYKSSENNYIEISSKPTVGKDFRFCEMGLWAGISQRLLSSSCQLYKVVDNTLKMGETVLFDTVNAASAGTGLKLPSVANKNDNKEEDMISAASNNMFDKLSQPSHGLMFPLSSNVQQTHKKNQKPSFLFF